MGSTLTKPETSKVIERHGHHHLSAAVCSMNGYRMSMEDAHCMHTTRASLAMAGLFDNNNNNNNNNKSPEQEQNGGSSKESGNENNKSAASNTSEEQQQQRQRALSSLSGTSSSTGGSQSIFGVFDGHVNDTCAVYTAKHLPQLLERLPRPLDESSLQGTFTDLDDKYLQDDRDGGSTAAVAIIEQVSAATFLCTVCNVGDSRVVVMRRGEIIFVTKDHKPTDPLETRRIEAAGGRVELERVNGDLALSRAMGDGRFKDLDLKPADRMVSAVPDVYTIELQPDDIVMIACDGVFEGNFDTQEVCEFLHKYHLSPNMATGAMTQDLAVACAAVCDEALQRGSKDNITCMLIKMCPTGLDALQRWGKASYVPGPVPPVKTMYHERDAFETMCKMANMPVGVALKKRFDLLMNRQALLPPQFSELDAHAFDYFYSSPSNVSEKGDEELQAELKFFKGGPPMDHSTEEQKVAWFDQLWAETGEERRTRPNLDEEWDF